MGLAQVLIIGMIIGVLFCLVIYVFCIERLMRHRNQPMGALKIDTSDPDGPYLFLELNNELDEVVRHKVITLVVDLNGNHPRN